jgi:ATP/maltotriose-dependent transcriptional regulator MalT
MLDVGLELARAEGQAARQGIIYALRARIALEQGALRDAQADAETGLQLVKEPHFSVGQLLAVLITVHVERGELDVADALARRGDAGGVTEDRIFLDEYLIARGRLRIAQGDAERGVADLLWCGERLKAIGLEWQGHWRAVAAPALASLGDTDTAERLAEEQLDLARRVASPVALGLSLRAQALTTDGERRLHGLEEAVAVLEPSPGRLELAHALADLGAELARSRRLREGHEVSRRAMQLARECGATALAERAQTELQSGPGRPARVELTGPGALTAAEWRVCREVAEGRTNREAAQAVFITEKTVERHLSSVYQKLGIRSRHQLREAIGEQ